MVGLHFIGNRYITEAKYSKEALRRRAAYSTTEDQLKDAFSQAGSVDSATIIMDKMSGRSKGFGFVEMSSDAEAQAAIDMWNGKDFGGRTLTVNEARPMGGAARKTGGGYRAAAMTAANGGLRWWSRRQRRLWWPQLVTRLRIQAKACRKSGRAFAFASTEDTYLAIHTRMATVLRLSYIMMR